MTEATTPAPVKLALHWHLATLIERYGLKRVFVEKESGVSVNTILDLCRRTDLDRFNVSNAERILNALRKLTGEDIQLSELVTISTSVGGTMLSVLTDTMLSSLTDTTPPSPETPLFEPEQSSKPQQLAQEPEPEETEEQKVSKLLAEANEKGLTVFSFPGTGVNKGSTIAIACENKEQVCKLTGVGKSTLYSGKLVTNPEELDVLAATLSTPMKPFIKTAGSSSFTEVKA